MAARGELNIEQYCEIYKLPFQTLKGIIAKGGDLGDARTVLSILRKTTRKPDTWREFFAEDEDSAEFWKKEKEKETVRGLRLKNELAEGEQFKREDVDSANLAIFSAFKLSIMEAQSQLPPQLAGLDEAAVEKLLSEAFFKLLSNVSDLSSGLWLNILKKYASDSDSGGAVSIGSEASSSHARKPVVPRKRAAGSGSDAEA